MSDDYHRPTLTFPTGAYNATQVRLYGKVAEGGPVYPNHPKSLNGVDVNVSVQVPSGGPDKDKADNAEAEEVLKKLRDKHKVSDAGLFSQFIRGIILSPFKFPCGYAYQIPFDLNKFGTIAVSVCYSLKEAVYKNRALSCGIIVGYAYEGHTYDLPKPKIMIIPTIPETKIPADDSGFDLKESEGYVVWIVDKLEECVEFEMNQGFVEQLVLDANLPGKRAPTMYAGRMMLGHRSGRLSE